MLRQYSVLLPFLSLCLYCYLCWHKSRGHAWLLSYVGFGLLASLSHFFAILFFASLTLFEAGDMLVRWHADGRKGKWGPPGLAQWLAANFVIAAFALLLYWHWQPSILSYQGYFTNYPESFFTRAAYGICIVFREAYYLFPMFPLLPAMMVYGIWRFQSSLRQAPHPLLLASVIAGLLCATLYALKQHPNPGGRHDLWMMPFILAAAGEMCATLLATKSRLQKAFIVIAAAGCVGAAVNECVQRYRYQGEVIGETQTLEEWQVEGQWQAIHKVLDSLGPHDLIDVTRRGGTQLTNIYASIKDDTFTAMRMAAIAPYENTHILFNPYYAADTNTGVMLSTLQEALNRSMLDDVDRLVFLQSPARLPAIALVMCDTLEKEIITAPALPAFPPDHVLQRSDLSGRAIIMLVSKQAIVDDVLNPDGKARSCLPAK
jgi:hypothetical protein